MNELAERLRARASPATEAGGGQDPLRCLSGAVPHRRRPHRRLRPLRQCRRRARALRPAGASWSTRARPAASRWCPSTRGAAGTASLVDTGRRFVTGIGAGTTYPDYKPAPFIVSQEVEGVDLVTVVTEGIFSYCGVKVKIDTDRHLGPEPATVRGAGRGGRPCHDGRIRLADAVARRRAPPDRRLARRKAASPATRCWRCATAGGRTDHRRRRDA